MAFERATFTCLARLVGDVVQVALRIGVLVVDRRRDHAVVNRENAHHGLDRPGRPEQWPIIDFVEETASS